MAQQGSWEAAVAALSKVGDDVELAALLGGLGESLGRFGKEIKRKSKNWLVCQEEMG
jgi:hypothetical protein